MAIGKKRHLLVHLQALRVQHLMQASLRLGVVIRLDKPTTFVPEDLGLFTLANATIWPIAINLTSGFKTVNPTILAVGRNIGLSPVRLVSDVLAPAALPSAITGLKTAWAFGWRTLIAAELVFGVVGGEGGLGNYINNAKLYLFTPQMFAALVTIALLGVIFEYAFTLLERRTIRKWGMQRS